MSHYDLGSQAVLDSSKEVFIGTAYILAKHKAISKEDAQLIKHIGINVVHAVSKSALNQP